MSLIENQAPGAYTTRWDRLREVDDILARSRENLAGHIAEQKRQADERRRYDFRPDGPNPDPTTWPTPKGLKYQRSDPHQRMMDLLTEAEPNGMKIGVIQSRLAGEGFATERQTIHKWLGLEISRETVRQPVERGPYHTVREDAQA